VTKRIGRREGRATGTAWLLAILIAAAFGSTASAHDGTGGKIRGTCSVVNVSGRATMTVTISNLWSESVLNVTPSDLLGSSSGSATFFVQTSPRPVRELLAGKSTDLVWKGRFYGDGYIDLSLEVFADFSDSHNETTGIINCNRIAVGNPDGSVPATPTARAAATATNTAPAAATATPTSAQRPTRTPISPRPTRTTRVDPTQTPTRQVSTSTPTAARPTRTPIPARPTRTPISAGTRTPTNTAVLPPTRTPTQPLPTRTPTAFAPTRTPIPVRPTRTPILAPTVRPTRTPNVPAPTPTLDPPVIGAGLNANCSLRRTGDAVTVTMIVDNRTGVDLTNVSASSLQLDPEGGALFFDRTGPSPTSAALLRNGTSVTFQWSGRLSPAGTMGFSAFATAYSSRGSMQTALTDCGVTGTTTGSFDPSAFAGECSISPAQNGQISVRIRNASTETLSSVEAYFVSKSATGTAGAFSLRGPAPRTVSSMPPGAQREFVFGATFLGDGTVTMRFQARSKRSNDEAVNTATIECTATVGGSTGNLPDLTVDSQDLHDSLLIETKNFTPDNCAVVEGCVDGLGNRKLLRFNTVTPNIGSAAVFLGNPIGNPEFIYSACHMHYHFQEYADYRLLDMGGNIVARGHKQAFCLVDLYRPNGSTGDPHPTYTTCNFQGISPGWADIYNRGLDCQWIDITGVPSGRYVLEVQINPAHVIRESNYNNNVGRTEVVVP
jgi:hypothetical protein